MMDWINSLTESQQFLLFSAVKVLAGFSVLMGFVAYVVPLERRLCAWMQDRIGPNRVGIPLTNIRIAGLGQPLADALKSFLKEDYTPGTCAKCSTGWRRPSP